MAIKLFDMDHIKGMNRHQMMLTSYDQMVHPESFARIIDAFADALDLKTFKFKKAVVREQGRPPYDPSDMLKLYLYGYQHGIRSCRKLEHAAKVNIEVLWLLKGLRPHYRTIASFRKENAASFRPVFRRFIALSKEWRLVDGRQIAVDSFKIRAQNSLKNNYNEAKIERHLDYIDQKIKGYEQRLDEADSEDEKQAVQEKIGHQVDKWNGYCGLEEELLNSGEQQLSTTDPDARAVVLHRNIVNVGYNVQAASDGKNKLIVALDTGAVNDTHALAGMVERAQRNLATKKGGRTKVLADKGYHTGSQLAACEALKVVTYVSPKANSANKRHKVFPMEVFKYHAASDTYRCPNGELLRSNGNTYYRNGKKGQPGIGFKHYRTRACKHCPIKQQCTSSARGRTLQRSVHQASIDRNNKRVVKNPDYYRERQQVIEHQFGTVKRQWGFTHALMKGKENVLAEVAMVFTAYNLRRSVSILGFNAVLKRLGSLVPLILRTACFIGAHRLTLLVAYQELPWCSRKWKLI